MNRIIVRLLLAGALAAGLAACASNPGPSAYQDYGLYFGPNTDV